MRLKPHQDAYGAAMLDYLETGEGFEIVERDDGLITFSDGPPQYFAAHKNWLPHEKAAVRLARGRVLDVGCGAGRVALHLQERGHEVVGIDVSPKAIQVCRQRGVRQTRIMSITEVDARLGQFDTIVMMGNNFGLFASAQRARWLLRRFHPLTAPDARIIAETLDPYDTLEPDHITYHKRNRRRGRMGGQARFRIRYRRFATPWFDYLFVSRKELVELIDGTGWQVARLLDGLGPTYAMVLEKT